MKPTPPTSTDLTFREMLEEVMDLTVGLGVGLLPLLLLAVPGIILFVVLPAIVLLLPLAALAAAGAVIAGPPYLLARLLRSATSSWSRASAARNASSRPASTSSTAG